MEAVDLSTTLATAYKTIWYHKPEGQCQRDGGKLVKIPVAQWSGRGPRA